MNAANIGMEIALLQLDTRGQAEASCELGVVAWAISRACCTVKLALPSLLQLRVISVTVCHAMICGHRQLCKVAGRVRSGPGDLSLCRVSC